MKETNTLIINFSKWALECLEKEIIDESILLKYDEIIIPKIKRGNKIHIKEKNRGKFTDYCGGKVTNECILRGKKSFDPKIRKRAIFAENSRLWYDT